MPSRSADAEFWRVCEACIHCGSDAFEAGWGTRTLIVCDCCSDQGVHVDCHEKATGKKLTEAEVNSSSFQWFCNQDCERISKGIVQAQSRRVGDNRDSEYCTELVRYSSRVRTSQTAVDTALQIFHSAIAPMKMDNGQELITMVCRSYESPDEDIDDEDGELLDFSNFRVFLLRKKGQIVTVATVRVFGSKFAEVPFVATREGYRREGNCRRLMQALESFLLRLGVQWIVIPAMRQLLPMWTKKFGYEQFSKASCEVLEERVVMPDPDSAVLIRKKVQSPVVGEAKRITAAKAKKGGLRFSMPKAGYKEMSDSDAGSQSAGIDSDDSEMKALAAQEVEHQNSSSESDDGNDMVAEGPDLQINHPIREHLVKAERLKSKAAIGGSASAAPNKQATKNNKAVHYLLDRDDQNKGADVHSSAQKKCYNCGIENPTGWSNSSLTGQPECNVCHRYRRQHSGQVRPPAVYQRAKAHRDAASKQCLQPPGNGLSSDSAACHKTTVAKPPRPALRSAGRAQPFTQQLQTPGITSQRKRRIHPAIVEELRKASNATAAIEAKEQLQRLEFDRTIAESLAGAVMSLANAADSQHAALLVDAEKRLERLHLEKVEVEGALSRLQSENSAACLRHLQDSTILRNTHDVLKQDLSTVQQERDAAKAEIMHWKEIAAARSEELKVCKLQLLEFQGLFQNLLAGAQLLGTTASHEMIQQPGSAGKMQPSSTLRRHGLVEQRCSKGAKEMQHGQMTREKTTHTAQLSGCPLQGRQLGSATQGMDCEKQKQGKEAGSCKEFDFVEHRHLQQDGPQNAHGRTQTLQQGSSVCMLTGSPGQELQLERVQVATKAVQNEVSNKEILPASDLGEALVGEEDKHDARGGMSIAAEENQALQLANSLKTRVNDNQTHASNRRTSDNLGMELFGMLTLHSQPEPCDGVAVGDSDLLSKSRELANHGLMENQVYKVQNPEKGTARINSTQQQGQLERSQASAFLQKGRNGGGSDCDSLDMVMEPAEDTAEMAGRGRRLAIILEQTMGSHESTSGLKSPPATAATATLGEHIRHEVPACPALQGQARSAAACACKGALPSLKSQDAVHHSEQKCKPTTLDGVDANGLPMLSPAQQLKELVESESQGKDQMHHHMSADAALSLALGVAANLAADLDGAADD